MMFLKLFGTLCLVSLVKCDISKSFPVSRMLSKGDIAEITRIAEENIAQELRTLQDEERPTVFVERPPPDADTYEEIDSIRQNIMNSRDVECNITASYLWELCRPVLLRTCKEQYRTRCRTSPRKYLSFNRRLQRVFPSFRPPEKFKPLQILPLGKWFENQISQINDAIKNTTDIQFSVSITNNNVTQTFTHEDVAEEIENITEQFQRSMNNALGKYRHLFRLPGMKLPSPRFFRHRSRDRDDDDEEDFGNWIIEFLSKITRDDEQEEEEDRRPVEVPAHRIGEAEPLSGSKSRSFDPSITIPKRLPKRRRFMDSKYPRHKRSVGLYNGRHEQPSYSRADGEYTVLKGNLREEMSIASQHLLKRLKETYKKYSSILRDPQSAAKLFQAIKDDRDFHILMKLIFSSPQIGGYKDDPFIGIFRRQSVSHPNAGIPDSFHPARIQDNRLRNLKGEHSRRKRSYHIYGSLPTTRYNYRRRNHAPLPPAYHSSNTMNRFHRMMSDHHKRFMRNFRFPSRNSRYGNVMPALPHQRHPSHLRRTVPPVMPRWMQPRRDRIRFPWMHGHNNENEDDDDEDVGIEITCEEIEENPEVCLEIAERTEKCEAELENVCPEYMEARRRISEKLDEVVSRQHQITHVARDVNNATEQEINEKYEWATQLIGQPTIVIDSIRVNQRGSRDAFVIARLSDKSKVELMVPGPEPDLSLKSLGKAIGKKAFDLFRGRKNRRHQGI